MTKYLLITILFLAFFPKKVIAQKTNTHQVFFDTEKFSPNASEKKKLDLFLKSMDTLVVRGVKIIGFCDDRGENPFNDSLSLWRAKTVRKLVTDAGYKATLVREVKGGGEIASTTSKSERSKNRRVDIIVNYSGIRKPKIVVPPVEKSIETIETKQVPITNAPKEIFTTESKVGDKIVLENILFEGGRHFMLPESDAHLRHLLKTLKDNPKYHIIILGHICCEDPGIDGVDNDTGLSNLSVARAKVIYDFLRANGINAKRLDFKGMKSDFKLGKGDKYDRRVEIEITKIDS